MNERDNKPLASQLARRIFAVYLALAISLALLQLYFVDFNESAKFSAGVMLIALAINAAALWIIIVFFANRLLTKPLQHFTGQIKSFNFALNFTDQVPTSPIDIGPTPSKELTDLDDTFCELITSVANKQRLMQAEAVTEAVKLAKTQFLAAAGHDLRQPMHALNLYLASFAELETTKPVQACLDNVNKCAKAMNDMLDTLLEISNIDAGATQARFSIFPIASPIDRIQAEFEPLAQAKGLTLRIARCSAFVHTDEAIVERILRLLVSNAVRYTGRGKILIGCRLQGERLRVAVYDTGLGIALDKQQAIFEEHFQLNNYERNRAKGLGLGLTIVQRLTKLLETSVTLDSRPGIGSWFAFDLPRITLDTIQPVTSGLHRNLRAVPSPEDLTIMVIDDEPLILDATRMILECWGYTVIIAASGGEALEKLTKSQCVPDLIFCDYLLGGGENGMAIIARLRAAFNKEIPAFLITGITSQDHIETMHASGLAYMYKPLDHDKLRAALTQFV